MSLEQQESIISALSLASSALLLIIISGAGEIAAGGNSCVNVGIVLVV